VLTALFAAAEPSKVPFYIAGGVLVVWAVALAGAGLTRPAFPFGVVGQRVVTAVSLVLAALAVAFAIATSG
jgi:hypothetical protein